MINRLNEKIINNKPVQLLASAFSQEFSYITEFPQLILFRGFSQ